jgi:hypothetical protein
VQLAQVEARAALDLKKATKKKRPRAAAPAASPAASPADAAEGEDQAAAQAGPTAGKDTPAGTEQRAGAEAEGGTTPKKGGGEEPLAPALVDSPSEAGKTGKNRRTVVERKIQGTSIGSRPGWDADRGAATFRGAAGGRGSGK